MERLTGLALWTAVAYTAGTAIYWMARLVGGRLRKMQPSPHELVVAWCPECDRPLAAALDPMPTQLEWLAPEASVTGYAKDDGVRAVFMLGTAACRRCVPDGDAQPAIVRRMEQLLPPPGAGLHPLLPPSFPPASPW